jgi:hypothetical protein
VNSIPRLESPGGQTDRESSSGHSILDIVGDLIAHIANSNKLKLAIFWDLLSKIIVEIHA